MSTPNITINNITFFLIRVVDNLHPRYRDVLEIHSHEHGKAPFSFWVYRSNSELGFWRLCVTKESSLQRLLWYKGNIDYVQATFIHLELQHFINENIHLVAKIQLDNDEKLQDCICYINQGPCSYSNRLATAQIDDKERVILEEPFSIIHSLDDEIKNKFPVGCGRIPRGLKDSDIRIIMKRFSDHLKNDYDFIRIVRVCSFSFNFERIIDSVGDIYCITLKRKITLKDSQTNIVFIYFLKTKLGEVSQLGPSSFTTNITRICSRDYHIFPFFITNDNARITNMGLYSKYIPSGIFICKLFDYHGYDQCTIEEIMNEKCTPNYSYIGKRYDDLFPLKEAIEELSSSCDIEPSKEHLLEDTLSDSSQGSFLSFMNFPKKLKKSNESKKSKESKESKESYETIISQPQLRSLRKRLYKDLKKLKHFHKINKSKKKRNVFIRRSRRK
jgi:hypothetical protein